MFKTIKYFLIILVFVLGCGETTTKLVSPPSNLTVSSVANVFANTQFKLSAFVSYSSDTNLEFVWGSLDTSRAVVDQSGLVTTRFKVGTARIFAYLESDPTISDTVSFVVNVTPVTGMSINTTNISRNRVINSSPISLKTTVEPLNASNKTIIWSSIPANLVSQSGQVSFTQQDTLKVIATTDEGNFKDTITFVIKATETTVTISTLGGNYTIGDSVQISVVVAPDPTSSIIWSSIPANQVNSSGLVVFSAGNEVKIIATTKDNFSDTVAFIINVPVQGIQATRNFINGVWVGSAQVVPNNATNQGYSLLTAPAGLINANNMIDLSQGSIFLIATSDEGDFRDSIFFNLPTNIQNLSILDKSSITLNRNINEDPLLLEVVAEPSFADKSFNWFSIPIGYVNQDGFVTFGTTGTIRVFVDATLDASIKDSIIFTVTRPVDTIIIDTIGISLQAYIDQLPIILNAGVVPINATDTNFSWASFPPNKVTSTGVVFFDDVDGILKVIATANSNGKADTVIFNVQLNPVSSVVAHAEDTVILNLRGDIQVLSPVVTSSDNTVLHIDSVVLSTQDTNIIEITESGSIVALNSGVAELIATSFINRLQRDTVYFRVNNVTTFIKPDTSLLT